MNKRMADAAVLTKKERVVVYVDGFNLYFGMAEAGFANGKWLHLMLLVENLLQHSHNFQMRLPKRMDTY